MLFNLNYILQCLKKEFLSTALNYRNIFSDYNIKHNTALLNCANLSKLRLHIKYEPYLILNIY